MTVTVGQRIGYYNGWYHFGTVTHVGTEGEYEGLITIRFDCEPSAPRTFLDSTLFMPLPGERGAKCVRGDHRCRVSARTDSDERHLTGTRTF